MSFNTPPNSFFNTPDEDDNAETQIDGPHNAYPQVPYPPYVNPQHMPPNHGQGYPPQPPQYGQPNPMYGQPPHYGQPPQYGPDHAQQMTNLGGTPQHPSPSQPPYPAYGQGYYGQPPTQMPPVPYPGYDSDTSETRFEVDPVPQTIQPLGLLIVKRPLERRGYAHHVKGSCTIGRRAGNILLAADDLVSEYHTTIRLGDVVDGEPIFWIADMNSKNGTKVNGVKIEGKHRLQNGDEIGIGRSIFVFMMLKD